MHSGEAVVRQESLDRWESERVDDGEERKKKRSGGGRKTVKRERGLGVTMKFSSGSHRRQANNRAPSSGLYVFER